MSKAIKAIAYGTAIIGTGYLLMRFTVPNEEQMRARLTPALRRDADRIRSENEEKKQALAERIREAANSETAIWDERSKK
ncbi:unnamed protein product [Umbelopsis ramanniana]